MPTTKFHLTLTPKDLRREAERAIRTAHPDVPVTITWEGRARRYTAPNLGTPAPAIAATLTVSAPGFRTRTMNATQIAGQRVWVR